MLELTQFLTQLITSDKLVLTQTNKRTYCRFFKEGVYVSRMYLTDTALLAELKPLLEGNEINATGIAKLKQLYLASDTHLAVDTL
ncbi:hypothetical protein WG947_08940 [Pontibacter sp. H259]|uniref:hypothetical protein n=1 Tax=Pontibacter sp. H259 TaxID=3133421 RepID=UPI0030C20E35